MFVVFSPPIRGEDGCFLYGVFNGYDGSRVASFASQCLTAELLLGQLKSNHTDSDVRRILTQVGRILTHISTILGACTWHRCAYDPHITCRYLLLFLQAFDVVEKSYFDTIDDALAEKAHLSNYVLPHNEVDTLHTHTLQSTSTD